MRALALCLLLAASPAFAVQPDEMLADPVLEARAREISRDLRLLVRERLMEGDSDEEVVDHIVARYGEFVLFNPRATGSGLVLWLAGPAMLLLGGGLAFAMTRRRARPEAELSEAEQARLAELMKE